MKKVIYKEDRWTFNSSMFLIEIMAKFPQKYLYIFSFFLSFPQSYCFLSHARDYITGWVRVSIIHELIFVTLSWILGVVDTAAANSFSPYCNSATIYIYFILKFFSLLKLKARGSVYNLKLHWGSTTLKNWIRRSHTR